jgi:hypothetical protein
MGLHSCRNSWRKTKRDKFGEKRNTVCFTNFIKQDWVINSREHNLYSKARLFTVLKEIYLSEKLHNGVKDNGF